MQLKISECLACEGMFDAITARAAGVEEDYCSTFCTPACKDAMLHELELGAQVAEAMNLDISEKPTINTQLKDALHRVGFKINIGDKSND